MIAYFKYFYHPSQLLSDSELKTLCEGGEVLEQDERGVKVIQLTSGKILKIFRIKRLISGARIYSYARRFCRNSRRLKANGIPTVTIKALYRFEGSNNTAVLYEPLPGQTLREVVKKNGVSASLAVGLAQFLSELHKKGVHFHSLHTGNVIQTPEGDFGLIDVSDLSIYPWSLTCNTRVRSFKRLCKYQDDIKQFGEKDWQLFQQQYFAESQLSKRCENMIKRVNSQRIAF